MYRLIPGLLLLFSFVTLFAQDTINQVDQAGKRQGYWRKLDTAGKTVYEGRFKDGIPDGEFRYFYTNGKLKTVSVISEKGKRARTVSYFPNGNKMASGNYLNEKKDSTWQFFNEYDGSLVSEEKYRAGIVEGTSRIFYPTGGLSETFFYKNGVKSGLWEQYYIDGKLKLRGAYLNGEKSGSFKTFYNSGQVMITGQYVTGHQDGKWIYLDEKGVLSKSEVYSMGLLIKVEEPDKK